MSVLAYVRSLYDLRGAFRSVFLQANGKPTNDAQMVLGELRRFCYGNKPALKYGEQGLDPYATVAAAARQEVYFRITDMLNLDDSDLVAMEKRAHIEDVNG